MSKDPEGKPGESRDRERKPIDLGVEPHPVPETTPMGGIECEGGCKGDSNNSAPSAGPDCPG